LITAGEMLAKLVEEGGSGLQSPFFLATVNAIVGNQVSVIPDSSPSGAIVIGPIAIAGTTIPAISDRVVCVIASDKSIFCLGAVGPLTLPAAVPTPGANGTVLTADSLAFNGMAWRDISEGAQVIGPLSGQSFDGVNGSELILPWPTTIWNTGGGFITGNNTRLTVPRNGKYWVHSLVWVDTGNISPDVGFMYLTIYKNSQVMNRTYYYAYTLGLQCISVSAEEQASSGDYFQVGVLCYSGHSPGTNITTAPSSFGVSKFTIHRTLL
jgi:hypothetical protein